MRCGVPLAVFLVLLVLLPVSTQGQEGREIRHEEELPVATLVEVFELDMTDAPLTGRALHLVEAADGSVFLVGAGTTSVLRFDREGAYQGEIGREGEGPGEFQLVTGLGMHGDTLWAGDAMAGRLTRFLPDGSLLDVITPTSAMRGVPSFLTLALDGSVVGNPLTFMGPGAPSSPRLTVWWRWRAGAGARVGVVDTLIAIEARDDLLQVSTGGMVAPRPQPFVEREPVAFSGTEPYALAARASREDGDGLVVVERRHFGGAVDTAVSVRYRPRRITSEDVDRVVDELGRVLSRRSGATDPASRPHPEIARALRRQIRVPEFHPALTDLVQGAGGSIWIGREAAASRRDWLIAQEGAGPLARISLADYQRPLGATDGYVWLLEPGAFDLPRIVRYRIETPQF